MYSNRSAYAAVNGLLLLLVLIWNSPASGQTPAAKPGQPTVADLMRQYRANVIAQHKVPASARSGLEANRQALIASIRQISGKTVGELETPLVTAAVNDRGTAYLFRGDKVLAWDVQAKSFKPGFPKAVKEMCGFEYPVAEVLANPAGTQFDFFFPALGTTYVHGFASLAGGPDAKPVVADRINKVYASLPFSTVSASLTVPAGTARAGQYLVKPNDPWQGSLPEQSSVYAVDPTTRKGLGRPPETLNSFFPGMVDVDASFTVPESRIVYLFAGSFYWVYDYGNAKYLVEGEQIDERSWPGLQATAPMAAVQLADLEGFWDLGGSLMAIDKTETGFAARFGVVLGAQGISSLTGSQQDREKARRDLAAAQTAIVGTDPRDMTMKMSNGTGRFKLLNPNTLEMSVPDGRGRMTVYTYAKVGGVAVAGADGVVRFQRSRLTVQGHPALRLPSGSIEFSFMPRAAAGPLFGAEGRFSLDYGPDGFSSFHGKVACQIQTGRWYHLIVTSDGFKTQLTLDGKDIGSLPCGLDMGLEEKVVFGFRNNASFDGEMKHVRVWDAAMPRDELVQLKDKDQSAVPASLRGFLAAENGKLLKSREVWEREIGNRTVYIVAHQSVPFSEWKTPRRAALTLPRPTTGQAPYLSRDAIGQVEQMFRIVPAEDGYYRLVNQLSSLPVNIADAKASQVYGKYAWVTPTKFSNIRVEVKGRYLAQAPPTAEPKASQFRFLRQVVKNEAGQFELAWMIQSRASAENASANKPSVAGGGNLSDSYAGEVVRLEKIEYGAPFVHAPYQPDSQAQQLFTFYPADMAQARPAPLTTAPKVQVGPLPYKPLPISLATFATTDVKRTLTERKSAYAALAVAQRSTALRHVAPVANDATGRLAALFVRFNAFYGQRNSRSFEDDFVTPVHTSKGGLATSDLRGNTDAAFELFRVQIKPGDATDLEIAELRAAVASRLNDRAALERLVAECEKQVDFSYTQNNLILKDVRGRFDVQPQVAAVVGGPQDLSAILNLDTAQGVFDALGTAADLSGDIGESAGLGWVGLAIQVFQLEKSLLEFSLSQLTTAEVVNAYPDGAERVDKVDRIITKSLEVARETRLAILQDLAALAVFDPTLMEEVGRSVSRDDAELKTQLVGLSSRGTEALRKEMVQRLLPEYGAIVGIARDDGANGINASERFLDQANPKLGDAPRRLDDVYNQLDHYSPHDAALAQKVGKESLFAASVCPTPRKTGEPQKCVLYTWHLVRRPASSKLRPFSPDLLADVRTYFPDPAELMKIMEKSTYVSARISRSATNELTFTDDAGNGTDAGEGIWLTVPDGKFHKGFAVSGAAFKGVQTGRDSVGNVPIAEAQFEFPESHLTLWYWPAPVQAFRNSPVMKGFPLRQPVPATPQPKPAPPGPR